MLFFMKYYPAFYCENCYNTIISHNNEIIKKKFAANAFYGTSGKNILLLLLVLSSELSCVDVTPGFCGVDCEVALPEETSSSVSSFEDGFSLSVTDSFTPDVLLGVFELLVDFDLQAQIRSKRKQIINKVNVFVSDSIVLIISVTGCKYYTP
ncbi:MAG: hypothetical protein IKZ59_08310 [Clostridia bacterium]|nr:hypothetical protein [Clostridia bacterium]